MKRITALVSAVIIVISGIFISIKAISSNKDSGPYAYTSTEGADEYTYIILFFKGDESLLPEARGIKSRRDIARAVVEELISGPESMEYKNTIPQNTRLITAKIDKNTAHINLSREFNYKNIDVPNPKDIEISSVVNSLTQLPDVLRVQFYIEGKKWGGPIKRVREMLQREELNPAEVLNKQMAFEKKGSWLNAYLLMSDAEEGKGRKSYHEYVKEMQEAKKEGLMEAEFEVGEYKIDQNDINKAAVKIIFITRDGLGNYYKGSEVFFNTVKVDGFWMVDWLTDYR
ncbi:sporulation and spore germination [Oxobacter pfennigii]|uniref:Sporulation and spore germination n=1 Tax=Oxobacter pfennigii TaxID=36849 RepID=A0A0P8WXB7_9CLOT|nr:GerMN domain-containing protein [Oxobacter pfennigii]KPU42985.1 sporulation and spore germination [Oxobacter pfennigii]